MEIKKVYNSLVGYLTGANATSELDHNDLKTISKTLNYCATLADLVGIGMIPLGHGVGGIETIAASEILRNASNYISRPVKK